MSPMCRRHGPAPRQAAVLRTGIPQRAHQAAPRCRDRDLPRHGSGIYHQPSRSVTSGVLMSTIAYFRGVIAADTSCIRGESYVFDRTKIARHENGTLGGAAGTLTFCDNFLKWIEG